MNIKDSHWKLQKALNTQKSPRKNMLHKNQVPCIIMKGTTKTHGAVETAPAKYGPFMLWQIIYILSFKSILYI